MKTNRVTVVIPCYNDGATIAEAVDSVQEAESIGVIVVDDGSDDGVTPTVLAQLGSTRANVRVVTHPENAGVSSAINTGVGAVTTPYAFILGADDLVCAGALARLADTLDSDTELFASWGDYEFFGARRGRVTVPPMDLWQLMHLNRWPGVAMVRVSSFKAVGGMSRTSMYEDWELWIRAAEAGYRCAPTPGVLAFRYRIHSGGARRSIQAVDLFPRQYRLLQELHPDLFARRRELAAVSTLGVLGRVRETLGLWALLGSPKSVRRLVTAAGAVVRQLQRAWS